MQSLLCWYGNPLQEFTRQVAAPDACNPHTADLSAPVASVRIRDADERIMRCVPSVEPLPAFAFEQHLTFRPDAAAQEIHMHLLRKGRKPVSTLLFDRFRNLRRVTGGFGAGTR